MKTRRANARVPEKPLQNPSIFPVLFRCSARFYSDWRGGQIVFAAERLRRTRLTMITRYRPLKTCYSENSVLLIDTHSSHDELLNAADQRLRAASDLLETLYCLCFKQSDVKDIPNIVNALYLLVQDGCDLLEVAKQKPQQ
jgi:hypothetical protein